MKKLAWFVVGTLTVASVGLISVACSTDPAGSTSGLPTAPTNTADSGTTTKPDSGTVTPTPDAGASMCTEVLHPDPAKGPFCYLNTPDGGTKGTGCAIGQSCCNGLSNGDGGFAESTCVAQGMACPTELNHQAFECNEKDDCPASQVCCTSGSPGDAGPRKPGKGTTTNKKGEKCTSLIGEQGTKCKASCDPVTDFQVCQTDAECAPKKCSHSRVGPFQDGICE
jgi:hypothetical protein